MARRRSARVRRNAIEIRTRRYEAMIMQDKETLKPLTRWIAQLQYNHIRRVESLFEHALRLDGKPLRGIALADDLVITRQRAFYRIMDNGTRAEPYTLSQVSKNYNLRDMQIRYRAVQDAWKAAMRKNA
jgi:hypothetical protein